MLTNTVCRYYVSCSVYGSVKLYCVQCGCWYGNTLHQYGAQLTHMYTRITKNSAYYESYMNFGFKPFLVASGLFSLLQVEGLPCTSPAHPLDLIPVREGEREREREGEEGERERGREREREEGREIERDGKNNFGRKVSGLGDIER